MTAFDATTNNSMSYSNVTNLSPYTNYTATCLVFKNGVDQCYIGNDTTQTYTDSKLYRCVLQQYSIVNKEYKILYIL